MSKTKIFKVDFGPGEESTYFVHPNRTMEEWKADVVRVRDGIATLSVPDDGDRDSDAKDRVSGEFYSGMLDAGYTDLDDAISGVYECRIKSYSARIIDYPQHEEHETGFEHYGSRRSLDDTLKGKW